MTTTESAILCVGEALIDVVRLLPWPEDSEHVGREPASSNVRRRRAADRRCSGADLGRVLVTGADEAAWVRRLADFAAAAGVRVVEGTAGAPATPIALADVDADGQARYTFELHLGGALAAPGCRTRRARPTRGQPGRRHG